MVLSGFTLSKWRSFCLVGVMSGSELMPCVLFGTQGHGNEARVDAASIAAAQAVR